MVGRLTHLKNQSKFSMPITLIPNYGLMEQTILPYIPIE